MEKKKIKLSVALAVRNEEKNLETCLESVQRFADEIVVVDGGSTDRTVEITKKFGARVIQTDNPPIFHINKQKALEACNGEWILQLDADEVVTEELKQEILKLIHNENRHDGYSIPRKNFFWGHFMKKGGQYPDYVVRLVKNGYAKFTCKSVHEQIKVNGSVGYLRFPLLHYSYRTKEDYWQKADMYTTLTAQEMKTNHLPKTILSRMKYVIIKPIQIFMTIFIRHKGFMDGWYGLVFAYWSALHFPVAYKKYRSML